MKIVFSIIGSVLLFSLAAFAIDYNSAPALDQRYYFKKEMEPEKYKYDENMPKREPASVMEQEEKEKKEFKRREPDTDVPYMW